MLLTSLALLAAPAPPLPQAQLGPRTRGGPGVAAPAAPIEVSRYVESAFGYVDPYAADFHPLGSARTTLLRRDESLTFFDTDQTVTGVRREDAGENRVTNGAVNFGGGGHSLLGADSGDLFGTGRSVAVTASLVNDDPWLRVWDLDVQGDPFVALEGRISTSNATGVDVACADYDGDGRDEIAVAVEFGSSAALYVFEDGVEGSWNGSGDLPRLVTRTPQFNDQIRSAHLCAAQMDDDDEFEIVFGWTRGFAGKADIYDDLLAGAPLLAAYDVGSRDVTSVEPVRMDPDGIDSIALGSEDDIQVYRLDAASQGATFRGGMAASSSTFDFLLSRPCVLDVDGDGRDEILVVLCESFDNGGGPWAPPSSTLEIRTTTFRFQSGTLWLQLANHNVFSRTNPQGGIHAVDVDVVALDEDMDGEEEYRAVVGFGQEFGPVIPDRITDRVEFGGTSWSSVYVVDDPLPSGFSSAPRRVAIVAGDDDGEATVLRWTGHKENVVSEPMPIMVMEAVPTRTGVGQNLVQSSASFTQGTSSSETISTRVGLSASVMGGVTTPDLFGVAEAQATATLSGEVARTTGTTETVRTFVTQTAGPEDHAIVFQGTLYTQYHYEVLSAQNPSAVGTTYALNVPVATEQWRWPLRLYNAVFPARVIDPAVAFAHAGGATVVGDPSTYATESELTSLVSGSGAPYTGWVGANANVGQGTSGSTTFGLDLSTISTTLNELTTSVELGANFKVGGALFGASFGVSNSWLYEVQSASDATFSGTIGDLPSATYSAYDYKAGIVVYEDDTTSVLPFKVMRFWTDPRGSAYP